MFGKAGKIAMLMWQNSGGVIFGGDSATLMWRKHGGDGKLSICMSE